MRGFLWCQGGMGRGKAKVSWDVVCLPKDEGALGIRRLDLFNKALMTSHIWKLLYMKDSLWVKWIHMYKIQDHNFWEIPCRGNMTWGWRKILQLRPLIRKFIRYKVSDGSRVSLWYDQWCRLSPLDMYRDILTTFLKVRDIFHEGVLVWPQDLIARYPIINSVDGPLSLGSHDQLEWRDSMGKVKPFSVNVVWQAIRPRDAKVVLVDVIWWHVKDLAGLSNLAPSLDLIINAITHIAKRRTTRSVIAKLVVAAVAYIIWQERNSRLFKKSKRWFFPIGLVVLKERRVEGIKLSEPLHEAYGKILAFF
ncbi:hypothetical protein Tco_1001927 [Tanacetum coccineum]|uniref:Reverse transcriptase zinc-binding domain-containing protein n=1 Tax=Tanacetum coccineum TaxID=301880 RepID=A0ABQ5F5F7_9ASTR